MELNRDKINRELERRGWSKYRLAKELKVKHQWVYFILSSSKSLTFKTVEKLAKVLDLDPKDLII